MVAITYSVPEFHRFVYVIVENMTFIMENITYYGGDNILDFPWISSHFHQYGSIADNSGGCIAHIKSLRI